MTIFRVLPLLAVPHAALACAMCGASVAGDDTTARAIGWSVLFLLAMPYVVAAAVGGVVVRRWRARAAAVVLALVAASLSACTPHDPLPVIATLPPFSLTDQRGATVADADLRGKIWVADFIFTRCPDICPALTARMAGLQAKLPPDVELVSISVDPTHDTPAVLTAYAAEHGAGPRWRFLTGSRDAVAALLRDGFKVAYGDTGPPQDPITHSDRFMLVDGTLRIRGTYHGADPEDLETLVADAAVLRAEAPAAR